MAKNTVPSFRIPPTRCAQLNHLESSDNPEFNEVDSAMELYISTLGFIRNLRSSGYSYSEITVMFAEMSNLLDSLNSAN